MNSMEFDCSAKTCTVVFIGGDAPEPEEAKPFFEQIKGIDSVIAADSGLDTLRKYHSFFENSGLDFSPDYVIGDMDSLLNRELLDKFSGAKKEFYSRDKDFTDTELALMKAHSLYAKGESFIVLVGGNGGRADHFIGILDTFSFDYRADCWLLDSGGTAEPCGKILPRLHTPTHSDSDRSVYMKPKPLPPSPAPKHPPSLSLSRPLPHRPQVHHATGPGIRGVGKMHPQDQGSSGKSRLRDGRQWLETSWWL